MPVRLLANNLSFRNTLIVVAAANFVYFVFETGMAMRIGSVSLFADSIDFLEDAAVNVLVLLGLGWQAHKRALLGRGLAMLLLVPGLATLYAVLAKFNHPVAPAAGILGSVGVGALLINTTCAYLLARHRTVAGSLSRAAFLSARNDAIANLGIIAAAVATMFTRSHWPDLIVGLGIFAMNLDAAVEVWQAAHRPIAGNVPKPSK